MAAQEEREVMGEYVYAAPINVSREQARFTAIERAKVQAFAERLFAEGGPAVDQVTKLFGEQTAKRLILQHMYGVR